MQLKKILLAFAALMSAWLWAPQAQAIPAFARQVGMACSACHYQHFPVINSFGRAFKEGGFTLTGAQEKVEGDGVSIPAVLNGALVGYLAYEKSNGPATPNGNYTTAPGSTNETSKNTNNGMLELPSQVSLFLAGRGGEHVGFEAEINLTPASGGTIPDGSIGLIRLKVPMVYDVGNVKAGLVPFSTGLGAADSFEVLNTGAVAVHAFNQEDMGAVSAQQYLGTATAASGVALIASNDDFFANVAKWGANQGSGASGGPSSNYFRAAWTTGLIPGFDSAIGVQAWTGTSVVDASSTLGANGLPAFSGVVDTKATAVDAQMMGDVGGLPLLVVASYATAPATPGSFSGLGSTSNPNLYNAGANRRSSFNIAAELGVLPGKATLQLAYRNAKSGGYVDPVGLTGGNATDNALLIGVTYNLALNVRAELTFSKYSGDLYNAAYAAQPGYLGDNLTGVDIAFGF